MRKTLIVLATALAACNGTVASGGSTAGTGGANGTTTGAPAPIGTLWVGGAGAMTPASITADGTFPHLDVTCASPPSAASVDGASAFDPQGNLWVSYTIGGAAGGGTTGLLVEWKASDLAACATATPAVMASTPSPLEAMAFDAAGNLWATFDYSPDENTNLSGITVYRAADLGPHASLTPANQLLATCGPVNVLCDPTGLAFDSGGYLWVASTYSVLGFSPHSLTGLMNSGTASPDLVLTTSDAKNFDGGGIVPFFARYAYLDPAFDAAGNLWVGVADFQVSPIDHPIVEISEAQMQNLASDETPTPVFVIHESAAQRATLFIGWGALAFDSQGNLWAGATQTAPNLFRYGASTLTGTSPNPDISISLPGDPSLSLAFAPTPAGLPLH